MALGYNNWVLQNFGEVIELAKLNGLTDELPADWLQRLEQMYNYQAYASMPNGQCARSERFGRRFACRPAQGRL